MLRVPYLRSDGETISNLDCRFGNWQLLEAASINNFYYSTSLCSRGYSNDSSFNIYARTYALAWSYSSYFRPTLILTELFHCALSSIASREIRIIASQLGLIEWTSIDGVS
jgi:hypothetical protein